MLTLLARFFLPDRAALSSADARGRYGTLCGALGIGLNLFLFAVKLFAGLAAGSIAVMADAFNNLTDAASSIITIIGFRLAGQKPDPEHPFGHGRMEHVAGLVISALILLTGYELLTSSIDAIRAPEPVAFGILPAAILVLGILVKGYMFGYNRAVGKRIDSAPLRACASDSLNDVLATGIVLVGMIVSHIWGLQIDGWCGVLISLFIMKAGVGAAKETVDELLGHAPDKELVEQIQKIVLAHEEIRAVHDLLVHDYGAGRLMVSLHAEVPADGDLLLLHDVVDNAERELKQELGCFATIHMDPVQTADAHISEMYHRVKDMVRALDSSLSMHDFRMVEGPSHTNLIFDVVAPHDFRLSDRQLTEELEKRVREMGEQYYAVIQIDKSFTG